MAILKKEIESVHVLGQSMPILADGARPLAIVDLSTIQRLASLLPKANFDEIKRTIIHTLREKESLDDLTTFMEEEVAFHKSINIITQYKPDTTEDIVV